MEDIVGPILVVCAGVALITADTVLLRYAIPVFQGREDNFLTRNGRETALFQCFGVLLVVTVLSVFHMLLGALAWWAAALGLFGFTIRQTIKLNIVFALFHITLAVGVTQLLEWLKVPQ
jgi:hypothetical protein